MSESAEIEFQTHGEGLIRYVQLGPNLLHAHQTLDQRNNEIRSFPKVEGWRRTDEERVFTEREGIDDLIEFIDLTINTAREHGDKEIEEAATLFGQNLVYVGETELQIATQGIAQHLVDEARKGKEIIVFPVLQRSEKYISLRVLEEIDYLTEENHELRERINLTSSYKAMVKKAKESGNNCLISVPDDFVVSGSRIQGFASRVYISLVEAGYPPSQAASMIEADVVAAPLRSNGKVYEVSHDENRERLQIFSYYGVPEFRNKEGERVVDTGASATGSHSSTDYGYETTLEKFHKYLKSKSVDREIPLLYHITRIYEQSEESQRKFKNPELQRRWGRIEKKYGLKEEDWRSKWPGLFEED